MKVYGLSAHGPLAHFSGKGSITSKTLFRSPEAAEAAKPLFAEKCLRSDGPGSLSDLDRVDRINLIEYDLED